jgi:ribonucleotide reductase alpha subunit/intein/homing endonuclease
MIFYDDVKDQTTEEYFKGNNFSIDAFKSKYALHPDESYVDAVKRVCDFIASVEPTPELQKYWAERWFDEIYSDWWHPAGSIMQGSGSGRKVSLMNCVTVSLGSISADEEWDNLESIIKNAAYTIAKTAAYRQGLGVDFSRLRPRKSKVLNSSNESTGSVHWMKFIDSIGNYVGQSGRVPAMLFSLSIKHPDIEEFITVKSDYSKIQNANISVQITDDFYEAVENDSEWNLVFEIPEVKKGDRVYVDVHSTNMDSEYDHEKKKWYNISTHDRQQEIIQKTLSARKLLELIARNMSANAEPGIQNIDVARKYSNSDYVYDSECEYSSKIISSNACSEQMLSRDSQCVLSSLNFGKFSTLREEYEKELSVIGESINRFLDNVHTCELQYETYATPHQKMAINYLRRTGAGYTNVGEWLFKQGLEYGTYDANKASEHFTKMYNYNLYKSSIALGKEKGNFGLFVREKYIQSPFIQRMMKEFPDLTFDTMRNVTLSSVAPTGCVHEDTRIWTSNGSIKIKDIFDEIPNEKEFVDVSDKNVFILSENGTSRISKFYNNGVVNGFKFVFVDGREMRVSETHRFRVYTNGVYDWKYAPEITTDDLIVSCLGSYELKDPEYQTMNDCLESNHNNVSDVILPNKLTEEAAELLGYFTGDGSIKFRSDTGKCDELRFPVYYEDSDVLNWVMDAQKSLFFLDSSSGMSENKQMMEVVSHSINVANWVINNGFAKKEKITSVEKKNDHKFRIPELIFRSPKSVISAYLRGLYEADGSIFEGHITLSSKHHLLILDVQELLFSLGIQSYICHYQNRKQSFGDEIYALQIRYKNSNILFRNLIGFISSRKNDNLNSFIYEPDREKIFVKTEKLKIVRKEVSRKISSNSKLWSRINASIFSNTIGDMTFINRDLLDDICGIVNLDLEIPFSKERFVLSQVAKIDREEFQTYDIEVEDGSHSYVSANGIINHNTLSLMFSDFVMSYGIEPSFGMYFWKRTRMSGGYEYYFCVPHIVREVYEKAGYPIPMESDTIKDTWSGSKGKLIVEWIEKHKNDVGVKFKKPTDIGVMEKLDLMSRVAKWIDSSISVTYMLPETTKWKEIYDFILETHRREVKSVAAFPDKKMYGIISYSPFQELAETLLSDGVAIHPQNFTEDELLQLGITNEKIQILEEKKRPKELYADVYCVTARGERFCIAVGLLNGQPYEVFGGKMNGLDFKFSKKHGKIIKVKKGVYRLEIGEELVVENFQEQFDPEEQFLFRFISQSLRYGVPLEMTLSQLQKSNNDITSLPTATARVLRKYLKEGILTGDKCPQCGNDLVHHGGCVECSCGYTKCL